MHSIQRQSKPRKRPYLSELISLESAALLAVQVESWNNVDGGWGATRLSGLLYLKASGLYWREGWMAESLALASADEGFDQLFRAHVRDLLDWISRFRGTQKRPSVVVSERFGFEAFTRGLSDEHQRWLEHLREHTLRPARHVVLPRSAVLADGRVRGRVSLGAVRAPGEHGAHAAGQGGDLHQRSPDIRRVFAGLDLVPLQLGYTIGSPGDRERLFGELIIKSWDDRQAALL
ncbi:hypothetical protein [Xanthomonas oryzae]|uniref:hypothetical protein n=1 Tax=Xanthomonas oryzae TaxID=347 RepID=UPI000AE4E30A